MLNGCVCLPLSGIRVWVGATQSSDADHIICNLQKHAPVAATESKERLCGALPGEWKQHNLVMECLGNTQYISGRVCLVMRHIWSCPVE